MYNPKVAVYPNGWKGKFKNSFSPVCCKRETGSFADRYAGSATFLY